MSMRNPGAALLLVLALTACNDRRDADHERGDGVSDATQPDGTLASSTDPAAMGDTHDASATSGGNDGELLGVLAAINQHEIDAATQAKQHKLPADVAKFADMMLADHRDNLQKTRALGANDQAPKAMAQAEKGKQHLQELGDTPDPQYAKAYVDAMVKGHSEALAALDDQLIPAAQAGPVKTHLKDTRAKVAEHLEHAKALQAKL